MRNLCFWLFFCAIFSASSSSAANTEILYQGRLSENGLPANGVYDLRFEIYESAEAGQRLGPALTNSAVRASDGLFTVPLDFGSGIFTGENRWLQIGVRTSGVASAYVGLLPRQKIGATPFALAAGTVLSGGLAAGAYGNAVALTNPANSFSGAFSGDGSSLAQVNASSLGGVSASNIFSRISTNNLGPFSYNAGTRAWAFRRDDWPDNGVSSAAGVALLNDGTGEPRAALWSSHDLGSGADANHGRLQLYGKCNLIGYSNWNCGSIEARNLRANVGDQGSDQRIWVLRPRGAEGLENPDCGGRMDILTRSPGGEFFLGIHQNEYGCLGLGPNIGYPWPNPGDISALVCISPGEAARGRAPMKFLRQVRSPDLEKTAQLLNQPEEGAVEFDGQFSITKENNIRMGLGGTLFREAVHREAQAGGTLPIKATTISSNTLSRNNNEIVINAAGMVLSTDPSNHLLLRFGHSVIFDSEAQLATPGISKWFLEARIVRRSNGSEVVTTHLSLRGGNDSRDLTLITEDCSANNPLELLAQGSVTLDLWEGEWKP